MADEEESELSEKQKIDIAKWFLLNSPPGEIQFVAEHVKAVVNDDVLYEEVASEAFPLYNKSHMISLEMPGGIGDVLVTSFGELRGTEYLDPKTAHVAVVDHIKQVYSKKKLVQVCTDVRPALDEELPSAYVECKQFLAGLLERGRLTQQQLMDRANQKSKSNSSQVQNAAQDNFVRLVTARFVERCPAPEPLLKEAPEQEGPKKPCSKSAKEL